MLALLALPLDTSLDYTGLPQLASSMPYEIRGHSATVKVEGDTVVVESTTEYRNRGDATTATILVPRRRAGDGESGPPSFAVEATWDKRPLRFAPAADRGTSERLDATHTRYASDLAATVNLGRQSTHALRLRATLPLGKTGAAPRKSIAGYLLEGGVPIGTLNVAFKYGPPTVFNLPTVAPDLGWQVGTRGAFARKKGYLPTGEVASIAFYRGGF